MTSRLLRVLAPLVLVVGATAMLNPSTAAAQASAAAPTDTIFEVRLRDGSILYGRITERTAERLVLVTSTGVRMELQSSQIERIRPTSGVVHDGTYWAEDPSRSRLFFTSTARPLEQGEGYIASFMLVLPFVAYGVTDKFTIAGGTPIIPEVIGRVWYLAPKLTLVERPNLAFAVGGLGFIATNAIDEGSVGIVYGAGTWGSTDRAVTAGAGWGYATDAGSRSGLSSDPVFMVGAETRVSRRVKLITENWMYFGGGESGALVSGGVRFIGDRLSADLGIGGYVDANDSACCLPLVNFVYAFGGRSR